VLLPACANVANLLIVRVESRHHEFAIRYAIGGGRTGIAADILLESSLIGLAGSLIGLLLALGSMRAIVGLGATNIPRIRDISITPSVLLFTVATAMVASLLIACVPILKSTSPHLISNLREGGRGVGEGRKGQGHTQSARHASGCAFGNPADLFGAFDSHLSGDDARVARVHIP